MLYSTVVRVRAFSALRQIEAENVFTFLFTINNALTGEYTFGEAGTMCGKLR
jgi:hypothetical protein